MNQGRLRKEPTLSIVASVGLLGRLGQTSGMVAGSRSRVDLAGTWERHVNGRLLDLIAVPSSLRPSGFYRLKREFILAPLATHGRVILHFDGITYHGRAFVNGVELGTMGANVHYEFEFTKHAKEGRNSLELAIADLSPEPTGAGKDELALGLNPGWEGYGGIIRDVYAEVRPAAYIDNLRLAYQLSDGYTRASCKARVFISSSVAASGQLQVTLSKGQAQVARGEKQVEIPAGESEAEVAFDVSAPDLWSPEQPNLYEFRARLRSDHGEDEWSCRTGFRHVAIRGNQFELNGNRLVLNGVCRHDMWRDQGFTLTRQQMAQDMGM